MITQTASSLDIKASDFPITKLYNFSGKLMKFIFKKNSNGFFTVEVWDVKNKTHLYSNRITYGQPIFDSLLAPVQDLLIPLNLARLNGDSDFSIIDDNSLGEEIKIYTNISEEEV